MAGSDLAGLPATFSYTQARRHGLSDRRLHRLRDHGLVETLGRGLYRRTDAPDEADIDLLEIARRAPDATLCLATALARHDLTDLIPTTIDAALPRGRRPPRTRAPVTWHLFSPTTFHVGRDTLRLDDETSVGIYGPERSIIDAFRLRHREGADLAYEALRRWLRRRDTQPSVLLAMAREFPKAEPALRHALEVLL